MVPFLFSTYPADQIVSGQQGVTTSAVPLRDVSIRWIAIKANDDNVIPVYVGGVDVATSGDFGGAELGPGDVVSAHVRNANALYVIAGSTGAGVSWIAEVL